MSVHSRSTRCFKTHSRAAQHLWNLGAGLEQKNPSAWVHQRLRKFAYPHAKNSSEAAASTLGASSSQTGILQELIQSGSTAGHTSPVPKSVFSYILRLFFSYNHSPSLLAALEHRRGSHAKKQLAITTAIATAIANIKILECIRSFDKERRFSNLSVLQC